jgi:hypothetical protein
LADGERKEGRIEFPVGGQAPRYLVTMKVTGADGKPKIKYGSLGATVTKGRHTTAGLTNAWVHARIPKVIRIGDGPPAGVAWAPYRVGQHIQMGAIYMSASEADTIHRHTHVAWIRTAFDLAPWMKEQRTILHVGGLGQEAVVYVNGKKVGEQVGPIMPAWFDVTEALKPEGGNELLIGIRDWISLLDPKALEAHGPEWDSSPQGLMVGPGCEAGAHPTAGIFGGVWLENRPELSVADVYADCSVRKNSLGVELTLHNGGAADRDVAVTPVVKDAGQPVLSLPERTATVQAGRELPLRIDGAFERPHVWSLFDPHLYELTVTIRDRKNNQVLDEHRSRFGFREFYVEDGLFKLNGEAAKLTCYMGHVPKDEGGSIAREMPWSWELDQADETGWLYKHNCTAGVVWPTEGNLASDAYWKTAALAAQRWMLRCRNHPSLVIWGPSNEYAGFCKYVGTADGTDGREVANRRLYELGQAMQKLDPVRPYDFDSDEDLGGRWNTFSVHYPRDNAPFTVKDAIVPDCYLFRPLDRLLQAGETFALGKYRQTAVIAGEIGQFSLGRAHDMTLIGGEEPYRSHSASFYLWQPQLDRYILDGVRDAEATFCHPWDHSYCSGTPKIVCPPRYVTALDYMGHWRAGEWVEFQANIHHDILKPEPMTVRWALVNGEGKEAAGGVLADRVFRSGELLRTEVRFEAPDVNAETRYRFVLDVRQGPEQVFSREESFVAYPKTARKVRLSARVGLYDPEKKSRDALALLGVRPQTVTVVEAKELSGLDVLAIGHDALTEETAKQVGGALQDFVKRGGRVVVFEHNKPPRWAAWLPFRLLADTTHSSSFAFPRVADHPVLRGIALEDLRFWRPDRVVSRHDYLKPDRGNWVGIVDAGGTRGLEWAPLVEMHWGKGSYLFCQLCLTEKAVTDPCAAKLLGNLLEYAAGPAASREVASVAVVAETNAPLAVFVGKLKTDAAIVAPEDIGRLEKARGLLVDGAVGFTAEQAQQLVGFAKDGGTVLLHGLTTNTVGLWGKALGARMELRDVPPYYSAMAIRRERHPLLTGLSMHEFHWRRRVGGDGTSFEDGAKLEQIAATELVTDAPGARLCTYPAVWVSIPCGKGEVVVDQVRWDTAGEVVGTFSRRIASTVLGNLGARFAPVPPTRTVDAALTYVPIDLAAFANRPMADDRAEDKEGGWSDQGPGCDGREFLTGRVMVKGIPFLIGGETERDIHDKTIIAFSSSWAPNGRRFKEQVTEVKGIPVNRRVETLNVLHTGAWIWPVHVLSYLVNYEDGSKEEIKVVGGINIMDWAAVAGGNEVTLPEEMPGISAQVGLIAACGVFKAIAAYRMEWINPYPDRKVATIDILAPFSSHPTTPIVMGITLGLKPSEARPEDSAGRGDRPRAEGLVKDAETFLGAGNYPEAKRVLTAAVAADSWNGKAYLLLGKTCRDTARPKEAIRYYQRAAGMLANDTEVLNELGGLLESQGRTLQALAVYRQSLEINWNQPPVMEAVSRLSRRP